MIFKELDIIEPNKWIDIEQCEDDTDMYICTCQCQSVEIIHRDDLVFNKTRACKSCIKQDNSERQRKKLEGMTFGKWKVEHFIGNRKYRCLCTGCNEYYEVAAPELLRGKTFSCKKCAGCALDDLTNKVFGNYKALYYVGEHYWMCECLKCRTKHKVTAQHLKTGQCTQCKECYTKQQAEEGEELRYNNWKDKVFGELKPVKYIKETDSWLCKCSCGNEKIVTRWNLTSGSVRSCGCKSQEFRENKMLEKYGDTASLRIHNPRDMNKQEILRSKEKFINLVRTIEYTSGMLPTSKHLSKLLDVGTVTILEYAKKYEVQLYTGNQSFAESELLNRYRGIDGVKIHDRKLLKEEKMELDLYFSKHNLAIELNGVYWHSELYKDKHYHQEKTKACAKKGVRLIHIFENEWESEEHRNKILSIIDNIVGINEVKTVYARNTIVKNIDNKVCKDFLNKYHLQGDAGASIKLGCYLDNELLGVMTFGIPRFNNKYEYEVIRLCWNTSYNVIGGTAKLLKYFERKYKPSSIITYADNSKFTGEVYLRNGFKQLSTTEPNYKWFKGIKNLSRYQTQKHKLIEQGLGDFGDSETEIMHNLGYYRVYDSGNIIFIRRYE